LENVPRNILGNDAHSQNFLGQIFRKIQQNMYESSNLVLGKKAA